MNYSLQLTNKFFILLPLQSLLFCFCLVVSEKRLILFSCMLLVNQISPLVCGLWTQQKGHTASVNQRALALAQRPLTCFGFSWP